MLKSTLNCLEWPQIPPYNKIPQLFPGGPYPQTPLVTYIPLQYRIHSVLPRNILRHVEVHATLSVQIVRDGCRKAQGKKIPKLLSVPISIYINIMGELSLSCPPKSLYTSSSSRFTSYVSYYNAFFSLKMQSTYLPLSVDSSVQ